MKKNTTFKGQPKPFGKSGHFNEPTRHALQAKGIRTGTHSVHPLDFTGIKPKPIRQPKEEKPIIEWMDDWDDEIKYRLENWKEAGYDEKPTEEQVQQDVWSDTDMQNIVWEDNERYLTEEMANLNKSSWWKASVKNFGWRSQSGEKPPFRAETGQELLSKILPDTDNNFRIFKTRTGFKIQNYHHDSPMGNEWYYVDRATQKDLKEAGEY